MLNGPLYNETHLLILNETYGTEFQYSPAMKVFLLIILPVFIFFTVLGNTLVMAAFIVDKRLRTRSNFFLLNLAICDFIIGAFNTPIFSQYVLYKKWTLGKSICKLWLVVDYTISAASVFNIVLISYDRFISITQAVHYRSLQKRHSMTLIQITSVWVISFLLYTPSILFWESVFTDIYIPEYYCMAGFFDTWYFHLITSVFNFFIPLISILTFNLSIYCIISKRSRKKRQQSAHDPSGEKAKDGKPFIIATNIMVPSIHVTEIKNITSHVKKRFGKSLRQGPVISSTSQMDNIPNTIHVIKLSRDKKVAKSLAILVSVFVVCWAPYTLLLTIDKAFQHNFVPAYLYDIIFWMLYLNSAINPVLYPLCHKSFRKAFKLLFQICLNKRAV